MIETAISSQVRHAYRTAHQEHGRMFARLFGFGARHVRQVSAVPARRNLRNEKADPYAGPTF